MSIQETAILPGREVQARTVGLGAVVLIAGGWFTFTVTWRNITPQRVELGWGDPLDYHCVCMTGDTPVIVAGEAVTCGPVNGYGCTETVIDGKLFV
jgi:hypothetical protein